MSLNETYNKLNKELQQNVKIEIEKAEKGKSKKSLSQLQLILSELEKSYDTPNVNLRGIPLKIALTVGLISTVKALLWRERKASQVSG